MPSIAVHPFNVRFATKAIESYGLSSFLADPHDLIEWKVRRGEDFLKHIEFTQIECDLIAALAEYRFLPLELFSTVLNASLADVARSLRKLEEFCCVERRENYFQLSSPLRDAIRRDKRFDRSDKWRQAIGLAICNSLADYKSDEHVPISLIERAVVASIRGTAAPKSISLLILPSHLLTIARDHYT